MHTENKTFKAEIKAMPEESTSEKGIFQSYANVFGNIDSYQDIVQQGAFTKTIKESKKRGLFYMHNVREANALLGAAYDLKETDKGLWHKGWVSLKNETGQHVFEMMREDVINEESIGFNVIKREWKEKVKDKEKIHVRLLQELKLFEISVIPHMLAANSRAKIENIKSIDDLYIFVKENKDSIDIEKLMSLLGIEPSSLGTQVEPPAKDTQEKALITDIKQILYGG